MKKRINFILWAFAIILAASFWSLDWALIRPQFYKFPPINIVFIEHLLWAIILSPFVIKWWNKIKKMNKKDILSLLWICFFWWLVWTLAITQSYFSAFAWETTIATVVILQKLQPIFALFLAWIILKEKLSKTFYIWAIISIISAYFLAFWWLKDDIFEINLLTIPAFYAILAAFAFWSSTVFWKTLVDDLWFKLTVSLRFLVTTILSLFILLLFWWFNIYLDFSLLHWNLLFVIVFITWAWALFLYYFWLKIVKASQSTIFELAWPISAVIFDYIFNWNILNPIQIISSIVLIIWFFMIIRNRK